MANPSIRDQLANLPAPVAPSGVSVDMEAQLAALNNPSSFASNPSIQAQLNQLASLPIDTSSIANASIPIPPGVNSSIFTPTTFPTNAGFGLSNNTPGTAAGNVEPAPGSFKVRLVSVLDMLNGAPGEIKRVVFEVTPTISESQAVEYSAVQPIHMPGGIQVYKYTNPRQFEISAHFIARNTKDALDNIRYLQILRSWTRPFFGLGSSTDISPKPGLQQSPSPQDPSATGISQIKGASVKDGVNLLGAPPEVLYLYGYSTIQNDAREGMKGINLNRIPVVITSLNINYPEDVDYIPISITPDAHTEPFPVKIDVSISLVETHSPVEYEKFSLDAFKSGTLRSF